MNFSFLSNRWLQTLILLMILVASVTVKMTEPRFIKQIQNVTFDAYNRMMPRISNQEVVIVDLDEASLREMGQWPWSHVVIGELLEKINDLGAKSIAFDMVFAEKDRTSPSFLLETLPETDEMSVLRDNLMKLPENDDVFAHKIKNLGNIVTGFVCTGQETEGRPRRKAGMLNKGKKPAPEKFVRFYEHYVTNLPELSKAAAGNGSFCPAVEHDGIIRRIPLLIGQTQQEGQKKAEIYPALSLETLRVALKKKFYVVESYGEATENGYGIASIKIGDYTIPTDADGMVDVYYSGHKPWRYIPAWRIMDGSVTEARVKDKIVLIGASAIGLKDVRSTPLDLFLPGVEIHAEIIEQILSNDYLQRPKIVKGAELQAMILIGLLVIILAPFISTAYLAVFVTVLIGAGWVLGLYLYQAHGFLVDTISPSLLVLSIFSFSAILVNLRSEVEKRMIRNTLGHYISPDLMEELTQDPDKLKLGGEVRDISVMFTDVRNFTSISENMDPADLIRMMNDFLTPMTQEVLDHRGTIDKYMGDAMMAFWNAPLDDPDHAKHACQAALKMAKALEPVNESHKAFCKERQIQYHELRTGIGIATGKSSVGNMGARQRFAYSALGDTVNLASRLEGQTKGYGVAIMTSEATMQAVPHFAWFELDILAVKGKKEGVRIYALLGEDDLAQQEVYQKLLQGQMHFLEAYRQQLWDQAEKYIQDNRKCANQAACDLSGYFDLMQERLDYLKQNPPEKEWDGVWVATSK